MKIKKLSEKLAGVCRTAFPHYRGRKWRLEAREKASALAYWSGGSKDYPDDLQMLLMGCILAEIKT